MASLAYALPPLSGLIAFLRGSRSRTRFHGLQAVLLGSLWPALLYVCSFITPGATQIAFVVGLAVWLVLLLATAFGRDPRLPLIGAVLAGWADRPPPARG